MEHQHSCCGDCADCAACAGCGESLMLTQAEVAMVQKLGQIPFLPVARKAGDETPVYLEEGDGPQMSRVLQHLERKRLIELDYHAPLKGFAYSAYTGYPLQGSFALTARGRQVLELLELQGLQE